MCNWQESKLPTITDGEYNTTKWVDLAWCREIHLGLDFNEERMEEIDVDDQPTPSIKPFQACDNAQLL